MKVNPVNPELASKNVAIPALDDRNVRRYQVIVEYAAGVYVPTFVAESAEEAAEAFVVQAPGCEDGEISLFDRAEQRVVACVKWKMGETEIGLCVPHRQNVFYDWHLALIALEVRKHRSLQVPVELSA